MVVCVQSATGSIARLRVYAVLKSARRYQLNVTAMPGLSSCCTPALYCWLYSRLKLGSSVRPVSFPKFGLFEVAISLSWAMSSPLVSFQVRFSLKLATGLNRFRNALESGVMNFPTLNLNAVLPSPKRSYAAPGRGAHDFQRVIPGSTSQLIAS